MGRSLLIRDRELEFSDIFMGRADVFAGGMTAEECLSKNEIRNKLPLGGVCFGIFMDVPHIYGQFVFVAPLSPAFVHLIQRFCFY
jgi:hypothetical protein